MVHMVSQWTRDYLCVAGSKTVILYQIKCLQKFFHLVHLLFSVKYNTGIIGKDFLDQAGVKDYNFVAFSLCLLAFSVALTNLVSSSKTVFMSIYSFVLFVKKKLFSPTK